MPCVIMPSVIMLNVMAALTIPTFVQFIFFRPSRPRRVSRQFLEKYFDCLPRILKIDGLMYSEPGSVFKTLHFHRN
jgi:hypothetical protein